jgi:peptidoglycan hydrolase-like protein with peptidoglycan-binding domain
MRRAGFVMAVAALAALISCTQTPAPKPAPAPPPPVAAAPEPVAPPPAPKVDHDLVLDEHAISAAQRALNQLGYDAGKPDGAGGLATRRAVLAFQKDHGLVEDGRLTFFMAERIRAAVFLDEGPKTADIAIHAGDMLIYSDGVTEIAAAGRMVAWEGEDGHGLVAVRPSVTGWPAAARAGLDWAITHVLEMPVSAKPVKWSSTGVDRRFEIRAFAALSAREATLVGGDAGSCRRFELRADQDHYPAIACRDVKGGWYIPHSTIRLARAATGLGSRPVRN